MCDLAGKFLQLIYHLVDRMLESRNLGILLRSMYQDLFAQVSIRNRSYDCANFPQHFLIGRIDLRILLNLPLQLLDTRRVTQSVQCSLRRALLRVQLRFDGVDEVALTLDFLCLLVDVFA